MTGYPPLKGHPPLKGQSSLKERSWHQNKLGRFLKFDRIWNQDRLEEMLVELESLQALLKNKPLKILFVKQERPLPNETKEKRKNKENKMPAPTIESEDSDLELNHTALFSPKRTRTGRVVKRVIRTDL